MQHFRVKSKYVGSVSNNVVFALRIFGWLSVIGGIVAGFSIGDAIGGDFNFLLFLTFSIYGGVSGVLLLGFAEVIELLKQIAMSEFSVDQFDQGTAQQSCKDSRSQQEPIRKKVSSSSVGSSVIKHNVEDSISSEDSSSSIAVDVSEYSSLFSKR